MSSSTIGRPSSTGRSRARGGKYVQTCLNASEYARFRAHARPGEGDGELARRLLFAKMGLPEEGLDPHLGETSAESGSGSASEIFAG